MSQNKTQTFSKDEEILSDIDADRERTDRVLRTVREAGEPSLVEEAAANLAASLLVLLLAAPYHPVTTSVAVAKEFGVFESHCPFALRDQLALE